MFRRAKAVPRSQELVFLDADDDLGTIRSKLESSTAEEIFLVIPRRSPVLRTPLEFRILARIANEMSSETILISDDGARRRLAQQEGFRTRRSLRTLRHLMLGPDQRPPRLVLPDWLPLPSLAGLVTTLGLLLAAAAAVLVALPLMRVTLVPQTNPVSKTVEITVDPDAQAPDPATGTLPGEVLTQTFEVADSLPVPADRLVGKDKARGEVVITSSRGAPFTLPKGTIVKVDGGPKFVLDQDRPLTPKVPARVGVTAAEPGSGGNQPPGAITQFEGPGLDQLEVKNERPTSGGTDRQAKLVTEEDTAALHDKLLKDARERGAEQLRGRAGAERTLLDGTLSVTATPGSEHFDQPPGTETDQVTGHLTASVAATVFQNLAFNDLVARVLERSSGGDSRLSGPARVETPAVLGAQGRKVGLRAQASGVLEREINPETIRDALRGSTPQDARGYLAHLTGLAEPPVVEVTPTWAPRVFRIDVNVRGPT